MEPTADEKSCIFNVDTLAEWAGLSDAEALPVGGDPVHPSPRAAFFALCGISSITHFRLLASLPRDAFLDMLTRFQVAGAPAPPMVLAATHLVYETSRRLCLQDPWPSAAPPAHAVGAPPGAATVAAATPAGRKFKLNCVSEQGSEVELEVLPDASVTRLYSHYQALTGGLPPDDEDPTVFQLSAVS